MSVTYYTATGQSSFNSAVTVGLPVWDPILPVPNEKVLFRQSFMQTAVSYSPLALDTPYSAAGSYGVPTSPTFYLVAEENFQEERAGILKWERVYAKVPTAWTDAEEYVFTFPGFVQTVTGGSDFGVTAIAASGANFQLTTSMTYNVGETVLVAVQYVRSGVTYFVEQNTKTVSGGTSGTTMNVPAIFPGSGTFTSVTGVTNKRAPSRTAQVTEVVASTLFNDYALTSVSGLDSDLPIIRQFAPVDNQGNAVTQLNASTLPTAVTYLNMIQDNVLVAAQNSVRRRFYGNIYQRTTRMVPAT